MSDLGDSVAKLSLRRLAIHDALSRPWRLTECPLCAGQELPFARTARAFRRALQTPKQPDGQITQSLSSPSRKNISLQCLCKSPSCPPPSRPTQRGVSRSSRTSAAGCGGRRRRFDEGACMRTAKSCGPDAPTLASSSLGSKLLASDGGKKAGHRGERGISRKTIARGMPGDFRCDLTNACAFYHYICTRGSGRIGRPAFPAPSDSEGAEHFRQSSGDITPRDREAVFENGRCLMKLNPSHRHASMHPRAVIAGLIRQSIDVRVKPDRIDRPPRTPAFDGDDNCAAERRTLTRLSVRAPTRLPASCRRSSSVLRTPHRH